MNQMRLPFYMVENADGTRFSLEFLEWRGSKAYLVSRGAAAYLADPVTGQVAGTESMIGITLRLVPSARKRLAKAWATTG